MMDWQAQQRAMKQRERQNKSASAATLHNYRGTSGPSQLSTIKAQDRKQQMEAQEKLHTYRASVDVLASMKPKPKERKGPSGPIPEQSVAEGTAQASSSVAELSAAFDKSKREPTVISPDSPASTNSPTVNPLSASDASSMVVVDSPAGSTGGGSDDWVSVHVSVQPAGEQATAGDEWAPETTNRSVAPAPTTAPPTAPPPPRNVDFSFAVITEDVKPVLERYTKAVNKTLATAGVTEVAPCTVRRCEQDFAFQDRGQKFVLYASVQIQGSNVTASRGAVLSALRAAIHDGSLLGLAQTI